MENTVPKTPKTHNTRADGFIEIPTTRLKKKLIFSIAINDADYITYNNNTRCPYYGKWKDMLQRCYNPKFHETHTTYIGCTVDPEWLTFSNFKVWMINQENNHLQLDKDLLIPNNKEYSPSTCLFISREINTLLNKYENGRGKYKIGVCWKKANNNFVANLTINGKQKHLGSFQTEQEAHRVYCAAKFDLINHIIDHNPYNDSEKALMALLQHADLLVEEYPTICNDPRLIDKWLVA